MFALVAPFDRRALNYQFAVNFALYDINQLPDKDLFFRRQLIEFVR